MASPYQQVAPRRSSLKEPMMLDGMTKCDDEKRKCRRVSFGSIEIIERKAPHAETMGWRSNRRKREDQARANLARLQANHKRMARSCGSVKCLSKRVSSVVQRVTSYRPCHAVIHGDVMLIGCQPGDADDVVLLAGANVSVEGSIVTVSNEGMPTLLQQLDSSREAQQWASQVKAAAETWDDVFSLAEVALKRKQALVCKTFSSVGDTGGTGTDGELSPAIADQGDEHSVEKAIYPFSKQIKPELSIDAMIRCISDQSDDMMYPSNVCGNVRLRPRASQPVFDIDEGGEQELKKFPRDAELLAVSLQTRCEIGQVCPIPKRWTELNMRMTGDPSPMDSDTTSGRYKQKSPLRWLLSFIYQPAGLCA